MTVIVQYVVERNGTQMKVFTSKKEADAYDKMLDIAEAMDEFLAQSELGLSDDHRDEVALFLAQHRVEVMNVLRGTKAKVEAAVTDDNQNQNDESSAVEKSEPKTPKRRKKAA